MRVNSRGLFCFVLFFLAECLFLELRVLWTTNASRRSITNTMAAKGIAYPMHARMAGRGWQGESKRAITSEPSIQHEDKLHNDVIAQHAAAGHWTKLRIRALASTPSRLSPSCP
ncbi:hypothetical protein MVEG_12039 [Podila verticillata NRRL 6337]|uniref:Secreted protein n=1 Tax=Podila verticillata NRRL 6337 TaxID=1069443 RepID=A0A086TL20_9FUNG|nr:hypothetical protein MVEG_12039 [Podila verticillata NRRL 6337]